MTKLNITNKTIYKLKKNKNQSKKKAPKKRKYKKRKQKNGRSFRKRRRKYNIKNNSIKKYKKQKGGAGEIDTKTASIKKKEKELEELNKQIENKREEIDNIRNVELTEYDANTAQNAQVSENKKEASNDAVKLIEGRLRKAKDYQNYVDNIRDTHKKKAGVMKYEGLLITLVAVSFFTELTPTIAITFEQLKHSLINWSFMLQ